MVAAVHIAPAASCLNEPLGVAATRGITLRRV